MGMYDNIDPDLQKKSTLITFAFTLVLFLIFLIFKLTAVICWSWWWVFAPLWVPFVLGLILKTLGVKPPRVD